MPLAAGDKLGPYEVLERIGAGGMGEVYRARDVKLGREVALKVLKKAVEGDPAYLRRFEEEARLASSLNHPNIVTIYGVGELGDVVFMAMEFVRGRTLRKLLGDGVPPVQKVLDISVQVADALAAAHAGRIMHRDLKPENIMLASEGRVKVLDFGLAKRLSRILPDDSSIDDNDSENDVETQTCLTVAGTILGTVGYMSPEQAAGRTAGHAADQFSFGAILYEMLSGQRAFQRATTVETLLAIMREQPVPVQTLNPAVTAPLQQLVERCLGKKPADRFADTRDLLTQLQDIRDDWGHTDVSTRASVAAAPVSIQPQLVSRRRSIWLGGAVVMSAAAGFTAWRLLPGRTGIHSLAVLPFESTPADDEDAEAFAVGLTESLIRKIAGLPALSVKSRAAVSAFKGKNTDPQKAGQQLGVGAIVTGSVTRRPGKLHVTAELVDVRTSAPLWGPNSYDRDEGDLQLIEDEIASAIVQDGIRLKLSPDDRARLVRHSTNDRDADKLYRLALAHLDKETRADYLIARDLLMKAVDKDPKFARAYDALARSYGSMAIDGYGPPAEAFRQMKLYANNALLVDPTILEVHGTLGGELFWVQRKWREAEEHFKMAARAPGAPVYEPYVYLLWVTHRGNEALAMVRRAQEEDPVSLKWRLREADLLLSIGRAEEAEKAYRNIIRDWPEDRRAYLSLAQVKGVQKQFQAAIDWLRQGYEAAGEKDPVTLDLLKTARGEAGYVKIKKREAQLELQYLQNTAPTEYVSPLDLARAHARLGDKDTAFRYLEEALEERSPGLVLLNIDPAWVLVRDDRRFADAVKKLGLP